MNNTVRIYRDETKVYYGDNLSESQLSKLTAIEVDPKIPPEYYSIDSQGELVCSYKHRCVSEADLTFHMNMVAMQYGYDDIKSAALRSAYVGPYQNVGIAFAQWMDACWESYYADEILNADEFFANLPKHNLPKPNLGF